MMSEPKWTVRKRSWPNGTPYFIVMKGKADSGQVLISDNGSESRFPSKEVAQHWANEHNKEPSS